MPVKRLYTIEVSFCISYWKVTISRSCLPRDVNNEEIAKAMLLPRAITPHKFSLKISVNLFLDEVVCFSH